MYKFYLMDKNGKIADSTEYAGRAAIAAKAMREGTKILYRGEVVWAQGHEHSEQPSKAIELRAAAIDLRQDYGE